MVGKLVNVNNRDGGTAPCECTRVGTEDTDEYEPRARGCQPAVARPPIYGRLLRPLPPGQAPLPVCSPASPALVPLYPLHGCMVVCPPANLPYASVCATYVLCCH